MGDRLNILQRMHQSMADVDYIQKEKKPGMNYTIVSHDAVTAKVRPVLVKHGIVYYPVKLGRTQDGNRTQIDLTIRFVSIDNPEDFIDVESCGYGVDGQDKGPGKAISYAVKYALLKALGLETGDDADLESIPHAQSEPVVDAKKEQYRMTNEIGQLMSPNAMERWWDGNMEDISNLPDEYREVVEEKYSMRLGAVENGTAKLEWKWQNVGDQDAWIEKAAKVAFGRCDTLQELAESQAKVQHKIEALETKRKASMIEFIQKRRGEIEAAAANLKAMGN